MEASVVEYLAKKHPESSRQCFLSLREKRKHRVHREFFLHRRMRMFVDSENRDRIKEEKTMTEKGN